MTGARGIVPLLARLLVVAVIVETLLFRIFARGGVYFIDDTTPGAVKAGYTALVFAGNVMFNFAAPLAILVLVLAGHRLWLTGGSRVAQGLALATVALAVTSAAMVAGAGAGEVSDAYLALAAGTVAGIMALAVRGALGVRFGPGLAVTCASLLALYAFKALNGPDLASAHSGVSATPFYTWGEWLAVAGILLLIPALPGRIDRRGAAVAGVLAVLALGMLVGRADSVPLIATWAFGLSLSLPYAAYVAGLWVAVALALGALRRGEPMLAAGVALLLLGHHTMPLTYFNDLAIAGLLLVVLERLPAAARRGRPGPAFRDRGSLAPAH